jgi:coenzyme F420-0:L-glutamate ligase / coenzyme F420-1:gamma-L-glutamate ligase
MLEILPVHGIGEVVPGDDLAALIAAAAPWLRDGDVLVVTSKIVSKAEGRLVDVPAGGPDRERARREVIGAETGRVVATRGDTRIVATHHGFVMASAGVDASNVDSSRLVLLPKDPDGSARALRAALAERHGVRVAVVISDTMGRPWRNGLTDVALGAAGIAPLRDHRGETDPYGNELHLTQMAIVDELAAAAELVKGKRDQVPVAVVRGLAGTLAGDGPGVVATLVREAATDMFSLGTAEARAAGLRDAAALPDAPPAGPVDLAAAFDPTPPPPGPTLLAAAVHRALTAAHLRADQGEGLRADQGEGDAIGDRLRSSFSLIDERVIRCVAGDPADPASLVRLGADVHRLRAALAAEGVTSTPRFTPPGTVLLVF